MAGGEPAPGQRATAGAESGILANVDDPDIDPASAAAAHISDEEVHRLRAYRYLGRGDTPVYVAIMRLFSSVLLAEWSATEVVDGLSLTGIDLDVDTVELRLRRLAEWGNLLPSPREVRVTSIAEYQRQAARYQLSKIGGQIQRDVDTIMAASDGAREVSRELLALVSRGLSALSDSVEAGSDRIDPTAAAETVSNLFLQFGGFASSITDFYAYVGSVVSRFDLDREEFDGFKDLLLDYLDTVVAEVALYTPAIEAALDRLWPYLPALLDALDVYGADFRALAAAQAAASGQTNSAGDRSRGRNRADWEEMRSWFSDGSSTSGSYQLRAAATRALRSLLANLKRINAASNRATSQRRDLLKLAGWFSAATAGEAHTLFNAVFSLHSARHIAIGLDDAGDDSASERVPATTPWWKAPTAPVPVSLRDRGDRAARGRATKPSSYTAQKQRLLAEHQQAARARAAACDELAAAAERLDGIRLSGPAMAVLVELFASATAAARLDSGAGRPRFQAGESALADTGLTLTVIAETGHITCIRSATGEMHFHDLRLTLRTERAAAEERSEAAGEGA